MGNSIVQNATYSVDKVKVLDEMQELAKSSFGMDVDLSRSSFTGYLIEMISDVSTNLAVKETIRDDEHYVTTAKLERSLMKIGNNYSYRKKSAIPSRVVVNTKIQLTEEDVNNPSLNLIFDSDVYGTTLDYIFMYPGTIEIKKNHDSEGNVYFSAHLTDNVNFPTIPISELPCAYYQDSGNHYVEFVSDFVQVSKKVVTKVVGIRNSSSFYPIKLFAENYLNKMDVFLLEVDQDNVGTRTKLVRVDNVFQEYTGDYDNYTYILEKEGNTYTIWLDNGSVSKYIKSGSTLEFVIYETNGSIGTLNRPQFDLALPKKIIPRAVTIFSNHKSVDGSSELTFDEQKRDLIKHIQTPNFETLVTQNDYNNYLTSIYNEEQYSIYFLMRRNDPTLIRTELFLSLIKEKESFFFTNSVNITGVLEGDFNGNVFISPKTVLKQLANTLDIEILSNFPNNLNYEQLLGRNSDKYLVSPFYYKLLASPNRVETFYPNLMKIYKTIAKSYEREEMIITKIFPLYLAYEGVFNNLETEEPVMKFELEMLVSNRDYLVMNPTHFRFFVVIFGEESGTPDVVTEVSLGSDFKTIKFETPMKLLDGIDRRVELTSLGTAVNPNKEMELSGKIAIYSFVKYDGTSERRIPSFLANEPNIDEYALISTYATEKKMSFYYNSNNINRITCTYDAATTTYNLYHLPAIALFDLVEQNSNKTNILSEEGLELYRNTVQIVNKIGTNLEKVSLAPTAIALKFNNTFGYQEQFENFNQSDVNLELEISFAYAISNVSKFIDDIKSWIVNYIFTTQKNVSKDKSVYLSAIISGIENNFEPIKQVRILNFCDNIYELPDKRRTDLMDKETLRTFTPAILNMRKENIIITTK